MRVATENVLADFLREIRDIARVHKQQAEERRARVLVNGLGGGTTAAAGVKRSESKMTVSSSVGKGLDERAGGAAGEDLVEEDEREEDWEGKGSGSWIPGQGIAVHYEEIVEILLRHVAYPSELGRLALVWAVVLIGTLFSPSKTDEIIQETVLHWLSEFIVFAPDIMIPATPSLIPAVLPNLAHPFAAMYVFNP